MRKKTTAESQSPERLDVSALSNTGSCDEHRIETMGAAPQTEILEGNWLLEAGTALTELSIHTFNGQCITEAKVSAKLAPGVTFGVLLSGELVFSVGGELHQLNAHKSPLVFGYNLLYPTLFERFLQKSVASHKVVVTLPWALLQNKNAQQDKTGNGLLSENGALVEQAASAKLIKLAYDLSEFDTTQSLPILRDAKALELAVIAMEHFAPKRPDSLAVHPTSQKVLTHIQDQLDKGVQKISVASIAAQMNMSKSTLQRTFKKHIGTTVGEYVQNHRLRSAQQALKNNQLSIGEAAYLAGYQHVSNFSSAYKKTFGVTPGYDVRLSSNQFLP